MAYSGTLDHSFHFDDLKFISFNRFIHITSLSIQELVKAGFESVDNSNRPIANISFALNYYFHGLDVTGYHLVNIIIHLITGIFLFYFVKITFNIRPFRERYGDAGFIPFFTALIWLVQPLHTQSITYIVLRMNSMGAMFFIMAMLFYVKARLTPDRVTKILFFVISFIAGIFAFVSKENTATLPFIVLLYEWYFFQDLRLKVSRKQFFLLAALGGIFASVVYFNLGDSPLDRLFPSYGGRPFAMAQRLLTQPRVVLHYISLIFYPNPDRLSLDYDFPLSYSLFSPPMTIIAILVIVVMLVLAVYLAKKNRLYSFCILWFLGNLVIESSTIPLEIIFEHRTYLPSMMFILGIVFLFHQTIKKKRVLIVLLMTVSLLFSYWTYARNKVWQNDLTLYGDNYKKNPNKARVAQYWGWALLNANRTNEALPVLEKALRLYEMESRLMEKIDAYDMATYYANLGVIYREVGKYSMAIFYLDRVLKFFYYSATYHQEIGYCYTQIGNFEKAAYHLTKALEFSRHQSTQLGTHPNEVKIEKLLNFVKMQLNKTK